MHAIREYQAQCNGSVNFHRHWLGITYTDGVKLLADTCGAYWLIDAIASHRRKEEFQVWTLQRGILICTNGDNDIPIVSQIIPYTDFPTELLPFKLWLENGTLMLPEER